MTNLESKKTSFEQCCLQLVSLLEEEYKILKASQYHELAVVIEKKENLQKEFHDFLFQFSLTPRGIPDDIAEHINAVHKLSTRNAAFLSGAIDGTTTILRELRKSTQIQTFTGLYNADGSFKQPLFNPQEIGKA